MKKLIKMINILFKKANFLRLIVLLILSISINSCNQATLNPSGPIVDDNNPKEDINQGTIDALTGKTWQLANIPIDNQNFNIIPTLKFETNGTLITTVLVKTFLNWELTKDGKFIITKDNINKIIVDTLEIKFLDANNLILEVVNDDSPDFTILKYIPFDPVIAKLDIIGSVILYDNLTNQDFTNVNNVRLITVWDVYKDGKFSQYIWGNQPHGLNSVNDSSNFYIYRLSLNQSPPTEYLNHVSYETYFGFGKVILTNQPDLPKEGLVTNLDTKYIIGGFNSKVLIFKKGDDTDLERLWVNTFPQGYSLADYTYQNQASTYWINLLIYPPDIEIRRYGLVIPKL